jgi:hypothetical protein
MSAIGVKRIWRFALQVSAFDPKRTLKALERGDDIIFKQTPIIDRF